MDEYGGRKMRIEPELTYQDYKDGVSDAFHLLGDNKYWAEAKNITDYLAEEDDDLLLPDTTSLFLWILSIGEYEIKHDLLEERVHDQLCYHIPQFQNGAYIEDLSPKELEQVQKDVDYILSKVEMYPVEKCEEE